MVSSEHLQIVNLSYCRGPDKLFDKFLMLPPELRLHIWEIAVRQYRLIEVEVEPLAEEEDVTPSSSEEPPPEIPAGESNKLASSCHYTVIVQGQALHSNLLRANSESRGVALRFYRVRLPCYHRRGKKHSLHVERPEGKIVRTLYFNSEYDFMHLSFHESLQHISIDFIHGLRTLDPRDAGLRNLALDRDSMGILHGMTTISETPARGAFADFLSRVEEIIWVAESPVGRVILPLQGFQGVGAQFNHSMPVKACTPFFRLMPHDPRPVGPELKCVLTGGTDPRRMRVWWQELLQRWDVRRSRPARERVLFAYAPPSHAHQICDVQTASQFLEKEEAKWLEGQMTGWYRSLIRKFNGKEPPIETPEQLAKAVRPAVGFWLFPVEALGDVTDDLSGMKKVFDMSGHWSELALSCLS